jgi:uncharacterized surface protein with fasciclin (FAS1) repeats
MKTNRLLLGAAALGLLLSACAPTAAAPTQAEAPPTEAVPTQAPTEAPEPTPTAEPIEAAQTIVDIAVADGRFTTLVAAIEAAGLVETLQGDGPFTVFAPTDEAFATLPEGTLDSLLADPALLSQVLLYHVVPGAVKAADVVMLESATTAQGEDIAIALNGENVMVNDATVVIADIEASNGVIHVIDAVILPPSMRAPDIVDTAIENGSFTTLIAAIQAAGLESTLRGEGPFTVFAPTDDAFAALPEGTVEALLADPEALGDILLYHVVPGMLLAEDVAAALEAGGGTAEMETVQGAPITVTVDGSGSIFVNDAQVIMTDIVTANGVIHVIDAVILPPES